MLTIAPAVFYQRRIGPIALQLLRSAMSLMGPGRVKTRSVLFVGGVSGDPGGIVRLGAANSAELDRADA